MKSMILLMWKVDVNIAKHYVGAKENQLNLM
jgi:hypothetical protein